MEYKEFCDRYQSLLMIGKVIETSCDYQLKTCVTSLEKAASQITPCKILFPDVQWLVEPLPVNDAWIKFKSFHK